MDKEMHFDILLPQNFRCQDTQRAAALEKASLNSTITNLKKELSLSKMNADSTAAELVRVQKVAGITEENQRLEIAALEDRCRRLTNMLEAETIVRRQNEEKATKYDLAAADLSKLQKEVITAIRCSYDVHELYHLRWFHLQCCWYSRCC